ncbi:MAG: surface antigen [Alphaproteobacteria bacterium]|jgi:surface antigen
MSKSIKRMSVLATALAAALVTMPFAAPAAVADPPRWAPAYGYDRGHGHHKYKYKARRHERRYERRREVRRTVYVSRPAHDHYSHRRSQQSDVSISPTFGGAIVGALIGGLGGSQIGSGSGRTAAIVGGIAAGAVIGGSIGNSMETADEARVQQTLETGRTGKTVIWQNPDTGNRYEVTPTRTYRSAGRLDCREYTSWVFLGGYEEQVTGTACRMPDGSWQRQAG